MNDEFDQGNPAALLIQFQFQYSLLVEVRQGDDLYQVAHWHCHKHSLGLEGARALSEQLEKVKNI